MNRNVINLTNKIWKHIGLVKGIDYEGRYEISNFGRFKKNLKPRKEKVRKDYKDKIISGGVIRGGYTQVSLWKGNKYQPVRIHRLVAQAFLGLDIDDDTKYVCHKSEKLINGKLNNSVHNIFIGDACSNMQDMIRKKRHGGFGKFGKLNSVYKSVKQLTKEGDLVAIWDSQKDAERGTGILAVNISEVCDKPTRSAGGYKWVSL